MKTSHPAHSPALRLISSVALWTVALLITGFMIGKVWHLLATDKAVYGLSVAAVAATTTVVGFNWQRSRARTNRQKAALDAYADREFARVK